MVDWHALALGTLLWVVIVASVAYVPVLFGIKHVGAFVGHNKLGNAHRLRLLGTWAGIVALGAASAAFLGWRRRLDLVALGRIALPLALAGPFAALLCSSDLELLGRSVAIAVVVVATERAVRVSLAELERSPGPRLATLKRRAGALLERVARAKVGRLDAVTVFALACSFAYVAYASYFTVLRHFHFQTMSNDLGQYDNFFYNALHGRPFQSNPLFIGGPWSALRSHAEFSMYALLPFYALHPHADTLLVLQSVLIGSAAIPVYLFGKKHASPLAGLVLCLAYLFFAPLHGENFYDVHFQPVGASFALWALYLLDARRWALGVAAFVLAVLSREDVPLIFIVVGVFAFLRGKSARGSLALVACSAIYFVAIKFVVMPRIGEWRYQFIYKDLFPPGDESYGGVIKTILSNPIFAFGTLVNDQKLVYALQILAPLAFLPLRGRWTWLSVLPGAVITVLTTAYAPTVQITFQYSAYLVALIFPAAALALEALYLSNVHHARAALAAVAAGTVLTTTAWGAIPPREHFQAGFLAVDFGPLSDEERQKDEDLKSLAALVPESASLAVSENELPHVSTREKCYDLKDSTFGADFLLYDKRSGQMGASPARDALSSGEYEQAARRGALVLLRKKSSAEKLLAPPATR